MTQRDSPMPSPKASNAAGTEKTAGTSSSANVAAIDIGTNSVRLLILSAEGHELAREMSITRLGQGVDDTGCLDEAAMTRTLNVLSSYGALLTARDVAVLRMTATSAARDAHNRNDFFWRVGRVLGQIPELLSGSEEARLSFLGATATLGPDGPTRGNSWVVFDIGGGSTEFARGVQCPERFLSLDIGAVRITERFLKTDPPSYQQVEGAREFVKKELQRAEAVIRPEAGDCWLGLAGTVTTFAAHVAGVGTYDAKKTHGLRITRADVQSFSDRLLRVDAAHRRPLLVEPKRAEVIVGGAIILSSIVEHFGLTQLTCSERDILDGLAASLLV